MTYPRIVDTGPIDPRWKLVQNCINGCDPCMVINIVPHCALPYEMRKNVPIELLNKNREQNGTARCLKCGVYWEVTPQGEIVNKSQWETKDTTPKFKRNQETGKFELNEPEDKRER